MYFPFNDVHPSPKNDVLSKNQISRSRLHEFVLIEYNLCSTYYSNIIICDIYISPYSTRYLFRGASQY